MKNYNFYFYERKKYFDDNKWLKNLWLNLQFENDKEALNYLKKQFDNEELYIEKSKDSNNDNNWNFSLQHKEDSGE